jgi:hypothetical protein
MLVILHLQKQVCKRNNYYTYLTYQLHVFLNSQPPHSSVICHTTGPQPLPKRFLHLMRSRASYLNKNNILKIDFASPTT